MTRNTPTRPGTRPRVAWRRNRPESARPDFSLQLRTSDRSMSMLPPACRQAPIFYRDAWLDRKSTGKGVREHAASATNRTMRASNGLCRCARPNRSRRPWHPVATLAITYFFGDPPYPVRQYIGRWKRSRRGTNHPEGDPGGLSIRPVGLDHQRRMRVCLALASTNPYAAHMVTRDDHLVGIITLKDMMTLLALKMDLEGID